MGLSIVVMFFLPWLDRSPVKSIRYRGATYKWMLTMFVVAFIGLGYLGTQPSTPVATWVARILSVMYFAFFLVMPWYTNPNKNGRYVKLFLITMALSVVGLLWNEAIGLTRNDLGVLEPAVNVSAIFFSIFVLCFVLMPWYINGDKTKPEPERVTG